MTRTRWKLAGCWLVCFAMMCAVLPMGTPHVVAQTTNLVIVDTGAANIRSGPAANTTSLGTVPGGTTLMVTGRNTATSWWRVDSPFGVGWISAILVAFRGDIDTVPIVTQPQGTIEQPTVIVDRLPTTVYRNPNPDSFIVGIAPTGVILPVLGLTPDGAWWYVETVVGAGFVRVDEVSLRGDEDLVPTAADPGPSFNGPTIRVNANTPLLSEPGGGLIGNLPAGSTLPAGARSEDNSWWQVSNLTGIGWIAVGNVSLAGAASNIVVGSSARTAGPSYTGAAFAQLVIEVPRKVIYDKDSYESPPMWAAALGETLGVTGRSPNGLWFEVTSAQGLNGWINFSGVTLIGEMANIPVVNTAAPIINVAIVNTSSLNVRSGPGAQYARLAVVSGGTTLSVTGTHPTLPWLRVERNDFGVGWVKGEFVIFRGTWTAVPRVTEPVGAVELPVAIVEINHYVYAYPNFETPVGIIPPGLYTIIGRNFEYTWALIETPLGDVWISFDEVDLRGIAASAPVVPPEAANPVIAP